MPVRNKAATQLGRLIDGPVVYDNLRDTVRQGAVVVKRWQFEEKWDKVYVDLVKSIDWNRVRLEAHGRCLILHTLQDYDIPCGECIEEVLLTTDTYPDWKGTQDVQVT